MMVENIIIEPTSTSKRFIIYGSKRLNTGGKQGVLYLVDFSNFHERECKGLEQAGTVDSDYEKWSPTDGRYGDQCLLGHRLELTRRKRSAQCYNPVKHEKIITRYNCPCTEIDYECDYGYKRSAINSI